MVLKKYYNYRDKMKKKFDYIYDNYGHIIIWVLLAIQAIAVAITTY